MMIDNNYMTFPPGTMIIYTFQFPGDYASWLILQSATENSFGMSIDERGKFVSALFEKKHIKDAKFIVIHTTT